MQCPKCRAPMQSYDRSGVQIEQCSGCRGIFLDYGELEALSRFESQWSQHAPPAPPGGPAPQSYPAGPAWGAPHHGHHGHHGHGQRSFSRMLFSS